MCSKALAPDLTIGSGKGAGRTREISTQIRIDHDDNAGSANIHVTIDTSTESPI